MSRASYGTDGLYSFITHMSGPESFELRFYLPVCLSAIQQHPQLVCSSPEHLCGILGWKSTEEEPELWYQLDQQHNWQEWQRRKRNCEHGAIAAPANNLKLQLFD